MQEIRREAPGWTIWTILFREGKHWNRQRRARKSFSPAAPCWGCGLGWPRAYTSYFSGTLAGS